MCVTLECFRASRLFPWIIELLNFSQSIVEFRYVVEIIFIGVETASVIYSFVDDEHGVVKN